MTVFRASILFLLLLVAPTAFAQDRAIQFRNDLDTAINLILTNNASGNEVTIRINQGAIGDFNVPDDGTDFDVRVMPLDRVDTGFRFESRNLLALAINRRGQPVPVGGIVVTKCCWYRTVRKIFGRWECNCTRDRIAAFIDESDESGVLNRIHRPVESY